MNMPCTNEARIAVMENTLKNIEPILVENTKAINNLSVVLAGMQGGAKAGGWMLNILAPMIGGGVISLVIILLTKAH